MDKIEYYQTQFTWWECNEPYSLTVFIAYPNENMSELERENKENE